MVILIVEDNVGDQRIIKEAFKRTDCPLELVFAGDSDEAAAVLQEGIKSGNGSMPNLILLDLNLPKKSGKDFLKELKDNKAFKKIPVLVLTSSNAETDVSECYSLGASCYLKKPMKFSDFQRTMEAICAFWLKEVTFAKLSEK